MAALITFMDDVSDKSAFVIGMLALQVGRYTNPDEHPFFPDGLPDSLLPAVQKPRVRNRIGIRILSMTVLSLVSVSHMESIFTRIDFFFVCVFGVNVNEIVVFGVNMKRSLVLDQDRPLMKQQTRSTSTIKYGRCTSRTCCHILLLVAMIAIMDLPLLVTCCACRFVT